MQLPLLYLQHTGYPATRQRVVASRAPTPHTVPHTPSEHTSTLPSYSMVELTSLTDPSMHPSWSDPVCIVMKASVESTWYAPHAWAPYHNRLCHCFEYICNHMCHIQRMMLNYFVKIWTKVPSVSISPYQSLEWTKVPSVSISSIKNNSCFYMYNSYSQNKLQIIFLYTWILLGDPVNPSCLHATVASSSFKLAQIEDHAPWWQYSSMPLLDDAPPTNRTAPLYSAYCRTKKFI